MQPVAAAGSPCFRLPVCGCCILPPHLITSVKCGLLGKQNPRLTQIIVFCMKGPAISCNISIFFYPGFQPKTQLVGSKMLQPSLPVFIICESKYANKLKAMCVHSTGWRTEFTETHTLFMSFHSLVRGQSLAHTQFQTSSMLMSQIYIYVPIMRTHTYHGHTPVKP